MERDTLHNIVMAIFNVPNVDKVDISTQITEEEAELPQDKEMAKETPKGHQITVICLDTGI